MKIWIFNHNAYPPDLPGGTRHYDLARELVKRGHQVFIFATSFHHHLHKETRLHPGESWKIEDINGVKFVWVRTPFYQRNDWRREWNMVVFMLSSWQVGRKLPKLLPEIGRPDVVIGSSPDLPTALAAYLVARGLAVPFVMEVRDLWPQTILDMGRMSPNHPVIIALRWLEKFLYHRAECIISLLPLAHEYITGCGIEREKIVWIPNGVDLSRIDQRRVMPVRSGGFNLMYLGAHGQANALDVILEAAEILREKGYADIKITFIGDGPEKPRLIALARELGLSNVEFLDPVPKNIALQRLLDADSLVLNLEDVAVFKYGISPNKLFDYMAAGKPVIFSVHASNNPVKEAGCGITVPPRNPLALVDAIIALYLMPQESRDEMGRRGQKYVAENHDISVLAGRLENAIESIGKHN